MLAHRQSHRAARALDFISELGPGGRRADDEHAAVLELIGVAVVHWRKRGNPRRHGFGERGDPRDITGPGRQYNGRAAPVTLASTDHVPRIAGSYRRYRGIGLHRGRDHLGVTVEKFDRLRHRAVAVRIVPIVAEARQTALPVGCEQAKRVPALGLPRIGDLAALEQHMVDRALGEAPAHGQTGLTGADHDGRSTANGTCSYWREESAS